MGPREMTACAELIDDVLGAVRVTGDRSFDLAPAERDRFRDRARELARRFPIPNYPLAPR
jgi:glycine hydroxymethyltransferase